MQSHSHLTALGAVLGLGAFLGVAAEPEKPAAAPKTPEECQKLVLKEIGEFRKLNGPIQGSDDEHIMRASSRRFSEIQTEVRIALAFARDRDAVAELVKQFDLEQADDTAWARDHSERDYGLYPSWGPTLLWVCAALEATRPELAQTVRRRMILLWQVQRDPTPVGEAVALDRLTLAQLKKAADRGPARAEAMRRWARLDPEGATPWLKDRMNDVNLEINPRFDAAAALARTGDQAALEWLKDVCFNSIGLGGSPGAALLEAGNEGAAVYFRLVAEHEKNNPGKPLPPALASAAESCPAETLFRHLPRLLELKDEKAHYTVRYTLRWRRLSAYQLAFLIDYLRKQKYADENLRDSLEHSLAWEGVTDHAARQAAGLWIDELHGFVEKGIWKLGARIYVRSHLGTADLAAAGARRHLKESSPLAAHVLAEVGRSEDTLLIWEATHPASDRTLVNWYDAPADGWLPIIRLTTRLGTTGRN